MCVLLLEIVMNFVYFVKNKRHVLFLLIIVFVSFFVFENRIILPSKGEELKTTNKVSPESTPPKDLKLKEDLLQETEESNITTKIYRSTDPSLERLDEGTQFEHTIQGEIIDKDELIGKSKSSKYTKRGISKEDKVVRQRNNLLFPWLIAFTLLVILFFIFRIFIRRKLI